MVGVAICFENPRVGGSIPPLGTIILGARLFSKIPNIKLCKDSLCRLWFFENDFRSLNLYLFKIYSQQKRFFSFL